MARQFIKRGDPLHPVLVVIQGGAPLGVSIRGASDNPQEFEVLLSKKARFEIIRKDKFKIDKDDPAETLVVVVKWKKE